MRLQKVVDGGVDFVFGRERVGRQKFEDFVTQPHEVGAVGFSGG